MNIGKDHKIESDSLNVTLFERRTVQKVKSNSVRKVGEEYWVPIAYFSGPHSALNYLVNHKVKKTGLKDLETVVEELDKIYKLIRSLKGLPELVR